MMRELRHSHPKVLESPSAVEARCLLAENDNDPALAAAEWAAEARFAAEAERPASGGPLLPPALVAVAENSHGTVYPPEFDSRNEQRGWWGCTVDYLLG
eukprot:SAG22_NODE_5105_length_1085_cov_1.030426_2_plen_99_part_00